MKKKLILLQLLLLPIIIGCDNPYKNGSLIETTALSEVPLHTFSLSSFEREERIQGKALGLDQYFTRPVTLTTTEKFAYILDAGNQYPVHIVNLETAKYLKHFSSKGYGPGELLAPFSIEVSQGKLWVYDIQLGLFQNSELSKIHDPSGTHFDSYIKVENSLSCISPRWINDEHFVSLNMEGDRDGRLNFFDQKGNIDLNVGSLNLQKPSKDPNSILLQAYQGMISTDPDKDNIIISNLWTDRIEVLDKSGKTNYIIQGPDNFSPSYNILNGPGSSLIMGMDNNARVGYYKSVATQNHIYALYSGGLPGSEGTNKLFVFDKANGRALKALTLDQDILDFSISNDEKSFFAISVGENPDIIKYAL